MNRRYWLSALALLLVLLVGLRHVGGFFAAFPEVWDVQLSRPVDEFTRWAVANRRTHWLFQLIFEPFSDGIEFVIRRSEALLLWLPWPFVVGSGALLGRRLGGWRLALLSSGALLGIGLLGLWDAGLQTLALMATGVLCTLLIGIPLGVWMALDARVERALRPLLDAMQTMPAFVYLIPVVLFFGIARVPSVIATVIYALPPIVRLTALGIRSVPADTLEAAAAFGATPRQTLWKVQLPLAVPSIMAGINQTIMMALGIVVIAALIGSPGLGDVVLKSLRRLQVGSALEGGLAIVLLAIVLDRLGQAAGRRALLRPQQPAAAGKARPTAWPGGRGRRWLLTGGLLAVVGGLCFAVGWVDFPPRWNLALDRPVDGAVRWAQLNLYQIPGTPLGTGPLSDFITLSLLRPLRLLLTSWLPWPAVLVLTAICATLLAGARLALVSTLAVFLVGLLGLWGAAMDTLSQVLLAVAVTVLIGVPLGIASGLNRRIAQALRPLLDLLQTIPAFVYLVPVIMLFNIGRVPGLIASVLYALPATIRLTALGIQQVDAGMVEAAAAFGATRRQTLRKVQLPLALPAIMLGINQTIMLVLAMVIIAGLVGAAGLGFVVVDAMANNRIGASVEAGLAIVCLAVVLDRLTQAWAGRQAQRTNLNRLRRATADEPPPTVPAGGDLASEALR